MNPLPADISTILTTYVNFTIALQVIFMTHLVKLLIKTVRNILNQTLKKQITFDISSDLYPLIAIIFGILSAQTAKLDIYTGICSGTVATLAYSWVMEQLNRFIPPNNNVPK